MANSPYYEKRVRRRTQASARRNTILDFLSRPELHMFRGLGRKAANMSQVSCTNGTGTEVLGGQRLKDLGVARSSKALPGRV